MLREQESSEECLQVIIHQVNFRPLMNDTDNTQTAAVSDRVLIDVGEIKVYLKCFVAIMLVLVRSGWNNNSI